MANIRRVTFPHTTEKAYQVKQKTRHGEVEEWVPKSVVTYIKKHPIIEEGEEQEYDLCIDDWWLDKTGSQLQ